MLNKIFLTKSVKCDISIFSEFNHDYESAGLNISGLDQNQQSDIYTYCVLSADCYFFYSNNHNSFAF